MQSHSSVSACSTKVHIVMKKNFQVYTSLNRIVFSADLNFWIESVYLSSVQKKFHIVGASKEKDRCVEILHIPRS